MRRFISCVSVGSGSNEAGYSWEKTLAGSTSRLSQSLYILFSPGFGSLSASKRQVFACKIPVMADS